MGFSVFNFDKCISAAIVASGYTVPTPIQSKAIPLIMQGKDVMGLAQTGTGKTAAFLLPSLQRLLPRRMAEPRMLIIAPTRELVDQIHEVVRVLGRGSGLSSVTLYGGVSMFPQVQQLRRGVDIVVACPGRLLDHIQRRSIDLSRIEILVLDEADRMFDMGFLPGIRQILRVLPVRRQTLFFSATMPKEVRGLAREILREPVTVEVAHDAPLVTVSHAIYPVAPYLKTDLLISLLGQISRESVLIFTRTKHGAKKVSQQLQRAGFPTACLQGNLSQSRRRAALSGFRGGEHQILVATDIAARGIDISTISHVINYDLPDTAETYTHRIGRTGRAERSGDALSLVIPEDAGMVRTIERLLSKPLKRVYLPEFDYRNPSQGRGELRPAWQRRSLRNESPLPRCL